MGRSRWFARNRALPRENATEKPHFLRPWRWQQRFPFRKRLSLRPRRRDTAHALFRFVAWIRRRRRRSLSLSFYCPPFTATSFPTMYRISFDNSIAAPLSPRATFIFSSYCMKICIVFFEIVSSLHEFLSQHK